MSAQLVINIDAVVQNWLRLQKIIGPSKCSCAAVVKANAYGLGAVNIARALKDAGCRNFFVSSVEEGVRLRAAISNSVMVYVLNGPQYGEEIECLRAGLIPVINSLDQLYRWCEVAKTTRERLRTVLHFDTGLGKLGLLENELPCLKDMERRGVDIELVISQLVFDEGQDPTMSVYQLEKLLMVKKRYPRVHLSLANSAGIFLGAEFHLSMTRPGSALYGITSTPHLSCALQSVVSFSGTLVQIKRLESGQGVGYNRAWVANRSSLIATIDVGYSVGYRRIFGNHAKVRFNGKFWPVVGLVSMDTLSVDVTGIDSELLSPGVAFWLLDEVYTINDLAHDCQMSATEILTGLGGGVRRIYIPYGHSA